MRDINTWNQIKKKGLHIFMDQTLMHLDQFHQKLIVSGKVLGFPFLGATSLLDYYNFDNSTGSTVQVY